MSRLLPSLLRLRFPPRSRASPSLLLLSAASLSAASLSLPPAFLDAPGPGPEADSIDWSDLSLAEDEETGCGFCLFMRSSPCGNHFRRWERCVASNKGDDASGNPKFVKECYAATEGMQLCIARNQGYYDAERDKAAAARAEEEAAPNTAVRAWLTKASEWEGSRGVAAAAGAHPPVVAAGQDVHVDCKRLLEAGDVFAVYVRGEDGLLWGAAAKADLERSNGALSCLSALPELVPVDGGGVPLPVFVEVHVVREEGKVERARVRVELLADEKEGGEGGEKKEGGGEKEGGEEKEGEAA